MKDNRARLATALGALGFDVLPSQANFVTARLADAERVRERLAADGIAVRTFPGRAFLGDALRITCPGDERDFQRLLRALSGAVKGA